MEVKINNKTVRFQNKDILGSGGEATIFQYQNQVAKIYHQPIPEREEKLKAFMQLNLWSLPKAVITPQELITDKQNQQIIGFVMEKIDPSYEVIAYLANDKFCGNHNLSLIDIGYIFLNMHKTLKTIHDNGLIVGDFNDLNELFLKHTVVFIDTDSFQFENYLCNVATESYLDPKLYNKDLAREKCYSQESDWYAFAVLLFRSLLLVHPYGGVHRTIKSLPERAAQKVTVFDSSVIYPKLARVPEILTDSFLDIFKKYFQQHERFVFPEKELQDYVYNLINCPYCNKYFPAQRTTCPLCTAQNIQIHPPYATLNNPSSSISPLDKGGLRGVECMEIFKTDGEILFFKIVDDKAYLIAKEGGKTVLYKKFLSEIPSSISPVIKGGGMGADRQELFNFVPGAEFDIFKNYLVFCPNPKENLSELFIFDLKENQIKGVHKTTTETYAGGKAVLGTSANNLFRLANGMLMKGCFQNGLYTEKIVLTTMQNQTWLSFNHDTDHIVGFFRIFNRQNWFTVNSHGQYELQLPELDSGEVLLDVNVQYTLNSFIILRKTRLAGVDYVRIDLFNNVGTDFKPVYTKKYKVSEKLFFEHFGNQIVSSEFILYAYDNGIVKEDLRTGREVLFGSTKDYVSSENTLFRFHDTILVVTKDRVIQLKLNN